MAEVDSQGCRLSYRVEGPDDAPPLLLLNSLGTTIDLWAPQLAPPSLPVGETGGFAQQFRVIRYDARGHGRSTVPPPPYTLDQLGQDALAVLGAAGAGRAHVAGISIGGLTGMWLGINAPDRVAGLVLANTGARIGTTALWRERIAMAESPGMTILADLIMTRWFTPGFRAQNPETLEMFRAMVAETPALGYIGCCAALDGADLRETIQRITAPVLVIVGTEDPSTPPALGELIRQRIPGAQLVALEAAHLSNVEQPDAFTGAVIDFLSTER
ncbi:MAG: 3-oxoadipate enol-lactonase [Gemmatimonadota bacterium]